MILSMAKFNSIPTINSINNRYYLIIKNLIYGENSNIYLKDISFMHIQIDSSD